MFHDRTERLMLIDPLSAEARYVLRKAPFQLRFRHVLRGEYGTGAYILLGQLRERQLWQTLLVREDEWDHAVPVGWRHDGGQKVDEGLYPSREDALMAAKCASDWGVWLASLPRGDRMPLRYILDAFSHWAPSKRPTVEKALVILPTLITANALMWWDGLSLASQRAVANDLLMCRYARAPHYDGLPALVRQLVQLDGERAIPGERPLTMAEQKARRAKPTKKARAAAPRRPPQDPAPQERRFGYCKRCHVCLAYDVASGCCTVCGRPLARLNPSDFHEEQIGDWHLSLYKWGAGWRFELYNPQTDKEQIGSEPTRSLALASARRIVMRHRAMGNPDGPHDNPGLRRFKDPGEATRHADRAANRSDTPQYVYLLESNPKYAVLPEGHPVQYGIQQGTLDMGATRLVHTALPAPSPNPHKRRKNKAKSSREDRRARLRRLLRL